VAEANAKLCMQIVSEIENRQSHRQRSKAC